MSSEFDIVIVGAGIAGLGLAAAIGQGPRVLILEQESRPAYHSTGRSAAIFIQNYGNATIRALSAASAPLFEAGDRALFAHPLLTPRGMMYVADEDGLAEHADLLAESEGMHDISPREAHAMVPLLKLDRIAAAAYESDARDIDVNALHEGWLRKSRSSGVSLMVDAPLRKAERTGGRWVIQAGDHTFSAPILVNAAGAWADAVAKACSVRQVGLSPMRRSMAVLPAPGGFDISGWPLVADSAEGWYAKPDAGKLYVSPADQIPVEPHDAYVDDMVLAEGLYRFEQMFDYPVTRVERSWAGLRTFAPDKTPVAGFDPSTEGFFWLAGQGGYGIQTSPALSALAAALVMGRTPPDGLERIAPALSVARFS